MQEITFTGQLTKIKPERLFKKDDKDEVANFFIVLGLVYNDLKSLNFHFLQTNNFFGEVTGEELSSKRGELGGIKTHLERLMIATIHEFFKFIDKNKEILETSEFGLIYKELNRELKTKWDDIVKISTNNTKGGDSDFFKILLGVRNNLAFHYEQAGKILGRGFIDFFYNDPKNMGNKSACYSVGENMSETRFFYCDAAAQRSVLGEVTQKMKPGEYVARLDKIVGDINFTIMALMKTYLKGRPY